MVDKKIIAYRWQRTFCIQRRHAWGIVLTIIMPDKQWAETFILDNETPALPSMLEYTGLHYNYGKFDHGDVRDGNDSHH
jgi:hypothetical protein